MSVETIQIYFLKVRRNGLDNISIPHLEQDHQFRSSVRSSVVVKFRSISIYLSG